MGKKKETKKKIKGTCRKRARLWFNCEVGSHILPATVLQILTLLVWNRPEIHVFRDFPIWGLVLANRSLLWPLLLQLSNPDEGCSIIYRLALAVQESRAAQEDYFISCKIYRRYYEIHLHTHTPTYPSYRDYYNLVNLAILEAMRFLTHFYLLADRT